MYFFSTRLLFWSVLYCCEILITYHMRTCTFIDINIKIYVPMYMLYMYISWNFLRPLIYTDGKYFYRNISGKCMILG